MLSPLRRRLARLVPLGVKEFAYRLRDAAKLKKHALARRLFPLRWYLSRRFGLTLKSRGINLLGFTGSYMSGGVVARGIAAALDSAGIPFNIINLGAGSPSLNVDATWSHREVAKSGYDISIIQERPGDFPNLRKTLPHQAFGDCYVIGYWFWELPELPEEWLREFRSVNEIWVASSFLQQAFSLKSPLPVVCIPPVIQPEPAPHLQREYFGLQSRRFLFLTIADTWSVMERKNPLGVVQAYKMAGLDKDASVGLVIKINNPDPSMPQWQALMAEISGCENVYIIDRAMTAEEAASLIAVTDCFVSLHRSEGFGLGPAEAMSLGKPAILTNWSANTDYMTTDNSIPIDYELVKLGQDFGPYKAHHQWAEPDLEQAAYWMKRIAHEPELAGRIGAKGQETIRSMYSLPVVARLIQKRLEEIRADA